MRNPKRNLMMAAILPLLAVSSAASAATILDITNVAVESYNTLNVNGASEITTAIGLTVTGLPKTLWVFCVDLDHSVNIGGHNPPLRYTPGLVTTDSTGAHSGTGNPLSRTVSGEIQTLASIGSGIANSASPAAIKLTAVQGAIWEIEYGFTPAQVIGTAIENSDIASYIAYAQAHPSAGYAQAIYPLGAGGQGFGYTQGFSTGVPEPASWAMMILGAGMMGATLRRRRLTAGIA